MFEVFRKPITGRRRQSSPGYANGFPVQPVVSALQFTASVQPAPSEAVQILPEGRRLTGSFMLFTSATLRPAESSGNNSDLIEHVGQIYEVMARMPWTNSIINHNAYLISRVLDMNSLPAVTPGPEDD